MLLISSFSAFAEETPFATENVEIVESEITMDVDYEDFNDDDQETIFVATNKITVKNNNQEKIKITIDAKDLPSGYSAESQVKEILAGESIALNLNINVPHEQEPGTTNIGKIVVLGEGNVELNSATLIQDTKSMLEMSELKVKYYNEEGGSESDSFDSDTEDNFELEEKVQVYSEISLEIEVKNLFDSDYDIDIDNVKLTIEADDDDIFPSDFDEEFDFEDLSAGDEVKETITFLIDEDADVKDYVLELTLEGEDDENIDYKIKKEITLELESEKDDVRILEVKTIPEELTLCNKQAKYSVSLKNMGYKDQDYVALSIVNEELGINENIDLIEIEKHGDDDFWEQTFDFKFKKAKTYDLDVTVYVDNDEPVDYNRFKIQVKECAEEIAEVEEEEEISPEEEIKETVTEVIVSTLDTNKETQETTTANNNEVITSYAVVDTVEDSYSKEDFIVAIMIIAIFLILLLIIVFFVVLLK